MKKRYIVLLILFISFIIVSISCTFATESNYNYYKPNTLPSKVVGSAKEKVLFIVDFSNSMNEALGSQKKIDVAIKTLTNILPKINPNIWLGMRVYGHKNGFTPYQSCTASELINPIQQQNNSNIKYALSGIQAKGWTPITYSLKKAVNSDFIGFQGKKRIILLSDGGENCDESPCDYAIELMKTRDDIKIDVIAFTIDDYDANNQLKCAALVTSGKFYTANTAAELSNSLMNSLNMEKDVQGLIIKQ